MAMTMFLFRINNNFNYYFVLDLFLIISVLTNLSFSLIIFFIIIMTKE